MTEAWREYLTYRDKITGLEIEIDQINYTASAVRSKAGTRFGTRTFDTFDRSRDAKAYDICKRYAEGEYLKGDRNGLLIIGAYGTGKTHLAAAIANRLLDDGVQVVFGTYQGLLEGVKNKFGERDRDALQELRTCKLLIMDDIGKEKVTEWTQSVMFDVVNARYENMLPTVFTTNLSVKGLEEYLGGAVYSRICETCTGVQMTASDKRKEGL